MNELENLMSRVSTRTSVIFPRKKGEKAAFLTCHIEKSKMNWVAYVRGPLQ